MVAFLLAVGLFLWPYVYHTGSGDHFRDPPYNPADHWVLELLLTVPLTGHRVLLAMLFALVIALTFGLLVGLLPERTYRNLHWVWTLLAAVPILVWVYMVIVVTLPPSLKGEEEIVSGVCATLFPLSLAFMTAIRAASGHRVTLHIRQLGAGAFPQAIALLRIAAPALLEGLRLISLAAWSVVLFAETQVAVRTSQGMGGLLSIWSHNGSASIARLAVGCLGVCCVAVVLAQGIHELTLRVVASNELDR